MTDAPMPQRSPQGLGKPTELAAAVATAGPATEVGLATPSTAWHAWFQNRFLLVWVAALTVIMTIGLLALDHREQQLLAVEGDHEGYAWHVAQYQLALERVRGGLQALAQSQSIGQSIRQTHSQRGDEPALSLITQAAVLASRTHVITDDSEYAAFFRRLMSFQEVASSMHTFNAELATVVQVDVAGDERAVDGLAVAERAVDQPTAVLRAKAATLLKSLDAVNALAIDFANDVRATEVRAAEKRQRGFERYRQWLLVVISVAMGGLLFWVGQLDRARKALWRTAAQRQSALEAERCARAQLQEAHQAKNQFMGMVSHELRSPLQSILSALDLLDIRYRRQAAGAEHGEGDDPQRLLIDRIRRASTGLEAQLRDLLTLAQGEAGVLELRPEPFEAVALVEDVVEQWQGQARAKGLNLSVMATDEPLFVVADPLRVTQIIGNLVSNAVKYTERGSIEVHVAFASMGFARDAGVDAGHDAGQAGHGAGGAESKCLLLCVSDTGPGIPDELQPRIYGAWRRFGSVDGRSHSAGIGLAILHTVVQQLGGSVELHSTAGVGSRFTVRVPVVSPEFPDGVTSGDEGAQRTGPARSFRTAPAPIPASASASASTDKVALALRPTSPRLLIVDDRVDVLEALQSVAAELGVACDVADGVAVAANLLAARSYDTVLIDLNMPIKSGQELASEVRRSRGPNEHARLLAMSAADLQGIGRAWPFDGFLSKPVDLSRLSAAIGRATPAFDPPPTAAPGARRALSAEVAASVSPF